MSGDDEKHDVWPTDEIVVGVKVKKKTGFQYPGVVVCVFRTTTGKLRCVVEAEHEEFKGMLHIYDPAQLELR